MEFLCAPEGPAKGKDYGRSPGRLRRPAAGEACGSPGSAGAGCARISGQAAPPPHGGLCRGQAAPTRGPVQGASPRPQGVPA